MPRNHFMRPLRMKRMYSAIGAFIVAASLSTPVMAFLPSEEAPPPPKPKPAAAKPKPAAPKKTSAPKAKPKPKVIHHKHPVAKGSSSGNWCAEKGGAFDEQGNCVKELTEEECTELGGILGENGVCTADPVVCEQKGGNFNDDGECVFK